MNENLLFEYHSVKLMDYIDDTTKLDEQIIKLTLQLKTTEGEDAESRDVLWVNIVFSDGTRLYDPYNFPLRREVRDSYGVYYYGILPDQGETKSYVLFVPPGLRKTLRDITEVFIRMSGDDAWFVGSVLLFANDHDLPLIGNSNINQYIDDNDQVLRLNAWSTRSFCVASSTYEQYPLPRSGYRVLGPVLGQISDSDAVVLYRVDREGMYHFEAFDAITNVSVHDQLLKMEPTGRFRLTHLQAGHPYNFKLSFVREGRDELVPDSEGSFTTYPADRTRGKFTFAFGSCADPDFQQQQGSWAAIRALALATAGPTSEIEPVYLFVHLGDSFYMYDEYTDEKPRNVETMHAAHLSMRRNLEFLDMAKVVPCCGVWDDHDFAYDDADISDLNSELRKAGVMTWLKYWGNIPIDLTPQSTELFGLTARISYGVVDIYILDGRFHRDKENGVYFGEKIINRVLKEIDDRGVDEHGNVTPRAVVLCTGANWNHESDGDENYGDRIYNDERENFFGELARRMDGRKGPISGLILISGDDHINEIYHVNLNDPAGPDHKVAPEFVSSPLTLNSPLFDVPNEISGERVWSVPSEGVDGKRGFATLQIDTIGVTFDNWRATVRYYVEAGAQEYQSFTYMLSPTGEFIKISHFP